MSDTKSSESAKVVPTAKGGLPFSLPTARLVLTVGGVALVATNLVAAVTGGLRSAGPALSAILWGGAAACFLASFVVYLLEPVSRREPSEGRQDGAGEPPKPRDERRQASEPAATPSPAASDAAAEPPPVEKGPLLRRGNPLRVVRGGTTALVASLLAFLLMARHGQWRWGVPVGAVLVSIASWGLMDLLGTFDDPDGRVAKSTTLRDIAPSLGGFVATSVLFVLALGFATAGRGLPQPVWGALVAVTFVAAVVALYELGRALGAWAVDETGAERRLVARHGFWVVAVAAALYFPFMGTYALWDPWETHYGEVAREMLARDDWISLWWAQDGWFWSKPVLDMWMQAIAMATLGVHYEPDHMLIGDGTQPVMHPEWAVRAPIVLLTIVALYLLYKGIARTFGRRAALLGSVVLATMPDWYFIAHQTMTDMPFVGAMTACMGLVLLGLRTDETLEARAYEVRGIGSMRLRLSGWHVVFGMVLVCAVPQILYLLSRNVDFLWRPGAHGFHPHWDEFRSGSGGGNCGLPGNEECHTTLPASIPHSTGANPDSFGGAVWRTVGAFEPALQGLLWAVLLGVLLYLNWGERRVRRLYYQAAWFFAALSTLAKGPAGFGLPVLVTLLYLAASRPSEDFFTRLKRVVHELTQFEIVSGLLLIVPIVALPWYIAMYVRHGSPFTDRLIFHDMFNRAFHHVHDTNEGDDTSFRFYVWQLGYALFPWTGLAPVGLLWWLRRAGAKADARTDASVLLCLWFVIGFALFSFMGTKFHHYIFPAVPPVGILSGVALDDMLGRAEAPRGRTLAWYLGGMAVGLTLLVLGIAGTQSGSFLGTKTGSIAAQPSIALGVVIALGGAAIAVLAARFFGANGNGKGTEGAAPGDEEASEDVAVPSHTSRMMAAGAVAAALLLVLVARDLAIKPENADQPGAIRLLHLFTYNYRRPWPDSLDFSAALIAFGAVGVLVCAALAVRAVRAHAVVAACVFGFVWAVWGLDVYMNKTAQHWGQHEIIAAYYADRASPDEILVAYQMNWKGENFYTGNRVPAFVSSGSTFTNWLKQKREQGAKVMYFITEHGRIGGLKSEVSAKAYREVTDKTLCNKFVLVRAEL
ncbi:MAG TPA: glycosyltransferase family 39 protein [Polyangiaceae bacterium]|nr:glycosyltransferase family 39 protein [Polyangiaceae bacterium]